MNFFLNILICFLIFFFYLFFSHSVDSEYLSTLLVIKV